MKNKEDNTEIEGGFQILFLVLHVLSLGLSFQLFLPFERQCDVIKREMWKVFLLAARRYDVLGRIAKALVLW